MSCKKDELNEANNMLKDYGIIDNNTFAEIEKTIVGDYGR